MVFVRFCCCRVSNADGLFHLVCCIVCGREVVVVVEEVLALARFSRCLTLGRRQWVVGAGGFRSEECVEESLESKSSEAGDCWLCVDGR